MAQEAPNTLHAAIVFNGTTSTIINSRGVVEAGFNKIGTGRYEIPLVDPVDGNACVISGNAGSGTHPFIMGAVIGVVGDVYMLIILVDDATGTAADGVVQVQVTKFATDD